MLLVKDVHVFNSTAQEPSMLPHLKGKVIDAIRFLYPGAKKY